MLFFKLALGGADGALSTDNQPNPPQKPPRKLQGLEIQDNKLMCLARTGSQAEGCDVPGPRFRVESPDPSVEMAGRAEQPAVSVDNDSTYDIPRGGCIYDSPRELGGLKSYENVRLYLN
jgi:hypothetical protein